LARIGWIAVAVVLLVILAILATRGSRLLLLEDNISDSFAALSGLMTYYEYVRIILVTRYLVLAIYLLTAFFIFWRKSYEVIGLATSLMLLLLPLLFNLGGSVPDSSLTVFTRNIDRILSWGWSLGLLGVLALVLVLYLFPSGRSVGPRVTRLAWFLVLALIATGLVADLEARMGGTQLSAPLGYLAGVLFLTLLALGIASQVYRYLRVSGPAERQQTRWVLAALVVTLFWSIAVVGRDPYRSYDRWAGPWALFQIFGTVIVTALLPLSIAWAIVSHHLWDIDVIIRKTIVYALLTGTLLLIYLTSILLIQFLFARVTDNDSTLATILSTLLIAALFMPLRRRIQAWIDRRFYRRKYDAAQVLERFAATARDETDLDKLTAELLRVIQETMQPAHASIWLRTPSDNPATRGE
jgi:hypothetical protein